MTLNPQRRQEMVRLELERAKSNLYEAEQCAAIGLWNVVGNRIYYAVFHAVAGLLIDNGIEASSHGCKRTAEQSKTSATGAGELRSSSSQQPRYKRTAEQFKPAAQGASELRSSSSQQPRYKRTAEQFKRVAQGTDRREGFARPTIRTLGPPTIHPSHLSPRKCVIRSNDANADPRNLRIFTENAPHWMTAD